MIPERTVTDAATIIFLLSSATEPFSIELEENSATVLPLEATLVTTTPTIILRTGNGPR